MKTILFVCIENSNRSQVAEAFAKIYGKEKVNAYSAGSRPSGKINEKAIEAMRMIGYDLTLHQSKSIDEVLNSLPFGEGKGVASFDYLITMGCGDDCPLVAAKHRENWDIADPKGMTMEEFVRVRDLIGERVRELLGRI